MKVNNWGALQLDRPCDTTGKVSYLNRVEASVALAHAKAEGRTERNVYHCPDCSMWHLTRKGSRREYV